jgi:uncharacterized protein (DUF2267 family)
MEYRQLVKRVQDYSGFSDRESEEALRLFVETLSSQLEPGERKDFASQLPRELQDLALSVRGTTRNTVNDIYEEMSTMQDISTDHAKKQVHAAWEALKDAISDGEIEHIRNQLPDELVEELH